MARQLREQGPGVARHAWGVEYIDQAFRELRSKGNGMRVDGPQHQSLRVQDHHHRPSSSHGISFQLAEGEVS